MSQRGTAFVVLGLLWAGVASSQKPVPSSSPSASSPVNVSQYYHSVISQYCVNCHNADDKVAGLDLDHIDLTNIGANSETLEKVVLKLPTPESRSSPKTSRRLPRS
jgi:hypothetical protein